MFSRGDFFDVWLTNPQKASLQGLLSHILQEFGVLSLSDEKRMRFKAKLMRIAHRYRDKLIKANFSLLDRPVSFSDVAAVHQQPT